jgi:hypothetical protein
VPGALGFTQIAISFMVNLLIILTAARLAAWFAANPLWLSLWPGRAAGAGRKARLTAIRAL